MLDGNCVISQFQAFGWFGRSAKFVKSLTSGDAPFFFFRAVLRAVPKLTECLDGLVCNENNLHYFKSKKK